MINNLRDIPPYMFRDDDGSFDQSLFDALTTFQPKPEKKPITIARFTPRISPKNFLSIAKLQSEDIANKNIVDIGGGAGCFALLLQNDMQAKHIEIIDPIFKDYSFDEVVKDSIQKLNNLSKKNEPNPKYQESIDKSIQNQEESKNILEKYQKRIYQGVSINSGYGDKTGLESDSQDIVFINHLIHKLHEDEVTDTITESFRILKKDGEIIIIDYAELYDEIKYLLQESLTKFNIPSENLIFNKDKNSVCIKLKK